MDVDRISWAWKQVKQRHSSLRTTFVESDQGQNLIDQVVLANLQPNISVVDCEDCTKDFVEALVSQPPIACEERQPPHRLTLNRLSCFEF